MWKYYRKDNALFRSDKPLPHGPTEVLWPDDGWVPYLRMDPKRDYEFWTQAEPLTETEALAAAIDLGLPTDDIGLTT